MRNIFLNSVTSERNILDIGQINILMSSTNQEHDPRISLQCVLSPAAKIGSYFFHEEDEKATEITPCRDSHMFQILLFVGGQKFPGHANLHDQNKCPHGRN
jgi:hypothetical protein